MGSKAQKRKTPKGTWYKVFAGVTHDTKLAVVAKRAGYRRGEVLAVWMTLLDHASTAQPRGSVAQIDAEEIAALLDCDAAAVESVLTTLREKHLILPDGMIANWRQHQDLSTPRTQAYRARRAMAQEVVHA
jgi:hypothetical protein